MFFFAKIIIILAYLLNHIFGKGMSKIQIGIIEDHHIFCELLANILNVRSDMEVVVCGYSGKTLLKEIEQKEIDLLILDLILSDFDFFSLIEKVRKTNSMVKIMVFTAETNPLIITSVLNSQVDGFFSKSENLKKIFQAIDDILNEKMYVSKNITKLIEEQNLDLSLDITKLTKREKEILCHIAHGKSTSNISEKLNISSMTVDTHRKNIRRKLNLQTHNELITFAVSIKPHLKSLDYYNI